MKYLNLLLVFTIVLSMKNTNAQGTVKTFSSENSNFMHMNVEKQTGLNDPGNNEIIISGTTHDIQNNLLKGEVMKIANNQLIWANQIYSEEDSIKILDVTTNYGSNEIAAVGYVSTDNKSNAKLYFVKFDGSGNFIEDWTLNSDYSVTVGTNIIYSTQEDRYIIGGFKADNLLLSNFLGLDGMQALVLKVKNKTIFDFKTYSTSNTENTYFSTINDITEVEEGYFVSGNIIANTGSSAVGYAMALKLDPSLNVAHNFSFEGSNYRHVGVSSAYNREANKVYFLSNPSVAHETILAGFDLNTNSTDFVYNLNMDNTTNNDLINPAGFQVEYRLDQLFVGGYFGEEVRLSELNYTQILSSNPDTSSIISWVAAFEVMNQGTLVSPSYKLNYQTADLADYHALGGEIFSSMYLPNSIPNVTWDSLESPLFFNQEILALYENEENFAFISPRWESSTNRYGFDLILENFRSDSPDDYCTNDIINEAISYPVYNYTDEFIAYENSGRLIEYNAIINGYEISNELICGEQFQFKSLKRQKTSKQAEAINNIEIVPNTASNNINFVFKDFNDELVSYKIFSISGKIVMSGQFSNQINLNLNDIPTGIYYVSFESKENFETKKFIKK